MIEIISKIEKDPEDLEIARLEKLLGVTGKGTEKKKAAEKLNKEYEMYEVSQRSLFLLLSSVPFYFFEFLIS